MSIEKNDKHLHYGLFSIQTLKFISNLPVKPFNPDSPDLIDYNISPKVAFKIAENKIILTLTITAKLKETSESIMQIETAFTYLIKDFKSYMIQGENKTWSFKDKSNEVIIPTLFGVSFSSMRGIIFEKMKGTILENAYLPMINPQTFFRKETSSLN